MDGPVLDTVRGRQAVGRTGAGTGDTGAMIAARDRFLGRGP
jgi:hypothetical protein